MIQITLTFDPETKNVQVTGNTKDLHPGTALMMLHAGMQPFVQMLMPKPPAILAAPASALDRLNGLPN